VDPEELVERADHRKLFVLTIQANKQPLFDNVLPHLIVSFIMFISSGFSFVAFFVIV